MRTSVLLALAVAGANAVSTAVPAIQTAIDMLNKMADDNKKLRHQEDVEQAKYIQYAEDTIELKENKIAEATEKIEQLDLRIQGEKAKIATETSNIAEHSKNVDWWNKDMAAATAVRAINKRDYEANHRDLSETLDALAKAEQVLQQQHFDSREAAGLIQMFPAEYQERASALVQNMNPTQDADRNEVTHGTSSGHRSVLKPIIDLCKELTEKFTKERRDAEREEMSALNAYESLMADLTQATANAEEQLSTAQKAKADAQQVKATSEEEKAATEALKADDESFLAELQTEKAQREKDFKISQQLSVDEAHAIAQATEVLTQQKNGSAVIAAGFFAQLRSSAPTRLARAVSYIQSEGIRQHSSLLAQLAEKATSTAGTDPFKKVKEMIFTLITKLEEEANSEAQHKAWCNKEMGVNKKTRDMKSRDVENTQADIDELTSKSAELTDFIAELSADLSNLAKTMSEATEMRKESKDTHDITIADAKQARQAINEAITILKNFFAKAAGSTANGNTGQQDAGAGVISMLETIVTDCTRTESKTEQEEAAEEEDYENLMHESKKSHSVKSIQKEQATQDLSDAKTQLEQTKEDNRLATEALDEAMEVWNKLKPVCVVQPVSYEERVAGRNEEIDALREALEILGGDGHE